MIDYELVLAEKQDFKAAVTTKAVDLGQKTPNIGLLERALWFVFVPSVPSVPSAVSAGTGSVTFTLEDSDDGKTFAPVVAYGPIVAEKIVRDVAFPFPLHHRRYVRVTTAVTGTVTTLAGTLAVADNFSDPAGYWRDEVEFYQPDPDASKIDLATRAKGTVASATRADSATTATSADSAKALASGVKVNLTSQVTGVLPVVNGGTGKATA